MEDDKTLLAECVVLLKVLAEDVAEIKADVKTQNGRVHALENAIERVKVLGFVGLIIVGLCVDWLKKKLGLS